MKILLLSCLFLIPALVIGQDTAITYSFIKQADSMSKAAIYEKVKLWAASSFKNASGADQIDDKETGLLAFTSSARALSPNAPTPKDNSDKEMIKLFPYYHDFIFNFKIQIKEGRYKIDFDNIKYVLGESEYTLSSSTDAPYKRAFSKKEKTNKEWQDIKETFAHFANQMAESIHSTVIKKEDW